MTATPRFGVKYPDGTYSGPITTSRRDAAHYGKPYHAEVYEVGAAEDPTPRHQREAEPWFDAPEFRGLSVAKLPCNDGLAGCPLRSPAETRKRT